MTEKFVYLDPHMQEISIGSLGTILDEPRGKVLSTFLRNKYQCFYDPYHGETIPVHRAMAEAFVGEPLPSGTKVIFLNNDRSDPRADNLEILYPLPTPYVRIHAQTGERQYFYTFAGMLAVVAKTTDTIPITSTASQIRSSLAGRRYALHGYHYLCREDDQPELADPWNHRPVVQVDYNGKAMQEFPDIVTALYSLGIIFSESISPTEKRKIIKGAYAVLDTRQETLAGYHLRYKSDHARRVRLGHLL